jgi:hypothetical protein
MQRATAATSCCMSSPGPAASTGGSASVGKQTGQPLLAHPGPPPLLLLLLLEVVEALPVVMGGHTT